MSNDVFGIIYKATNLINSKCYIGQTTQKFSKRKRGHLWLASMNKGYIFHEALRTDGVENFSWEILCECSSIKELEDKELYYIKEYNSVENGYNARYSNSTITDDVKLKISNSNKGRKLTKKQKDHLSEISKENWKNSREIFIDGIKNRPYYGDKISKKKKEQFANGEIIHPFLGKHHNELTKQKISKKAIQRFSNKENNPMYGKHHSDEVKKKISDKKRKYDKDIINEAIRLRQLGYTYGYICENLNIPNEATVCKWCRCLRDK